MTQADHKPDEDEVALLALLPADGAPEDSSEIRSRLGWEVERYAGVCVRLEGRGYILAGEGHSKTVCRDLTAIPPEFRPACGHPGSRVTVRQVPVTVPHALCDLTGVILSYPGHGGAAVRDSPGRGVGNSKGIRVEVDAHTMDLTVTLSGLRRNV
jgi:hypothetical protein